VAASLDALIRLVREAQNLTYDEAKIAVDLVNSLVLKRPHKVFGNLIKCIADLVKSKNVPKGHWQPYWIVAMRTFECWKGGRSKNECVNYALSAIAGMPHVDTRLARSIAETVYDKVADCIQQSGAWIKRFYPVAGAGAAPARR